MSAVFGADMRRVFKGVTRYVPKFYGWTFKRWAVGVIVQRNTQDQHSTEQKGGWLVDDVHVYDGYCRHCHNRREDRMERELTRLRRVEVAARNALANGNVLNRGSDDADALAAALYDLGGPVVESAPADPRSTP